MPGYRLVEGSRVFKQVQDDVHHALGMDCIDCHTGFELMGDGTFYAHQEEQEVVGCSDCHFDGQPNTINQTKLDEESALIASLRFGNITGRNFLKTKKRNQALINTFYRNDSAFLVTKNTKQFFHLSPPAETCTRGQAHDKLSCSSCHTAWAPSCIGCHNEYDPGEASYNMLANKAEIGGWVEYVGEYNAHAPALGIRTVQH